MSENKPDIKKLLKNRVLVLDGAMGTMIQQRRLSEAGFRGTRFADHKFELKGNNDILVLTNPDIIYDIHSAYLEAGADIIETDTFNATSVSMADYGAEGYVEEINRKAAEIASKAAARFSTPEKPRYVAGSIGPTNKSCSISPDVENPAARSIGYDGLFEAYRQQISALIEGGVDLLLFETVFDTLNAKCALDAAEEAFAACGKRLPVMLSLTVADRGGRTLSGQTIEAFLASVSHANLLSIGINCSFGAKEILPFLRELSEKAGCFVSVHPNAGLPNRFGEYEETPESMLANIRPYFDERLVNIIGGCCGTTPEHIALIARAAADAVPHVPADNDSGLVLSGLEPLAVNRSNNFINVGERCNVAGSRKFLRLISEKNYDEALQIARKQVEDGAQIIDINMDDGMLDARSEMVNFLNLISSEPEICRVPIMVDSSKWDVIEAGLKCLQGKSIVNSISLKEGEDVFLEHAARIKRLGAAMVVMAFDETGQADTFERKIEVCKRAYMLLTEKAGIAPEDIIFDPNVLAVATGIESHRKYAYDFIRAVKWIKENLKGAKVSGGISNLSFSFRGNNYIREAMHSVFLFHAIKEGMDMGIVNPASSLTYSDIQEDILTAVEDVIFDRRDDATERLIEVASRVKGANTEGKEVTQLDATACKSVEERLAHALIKGVAENLHDDIMEAAAKYGSAVAVIEKPLMDGMGAVGRLFGEGKMFLPQVVKSARVMKQAVEILQPLIEKEKGDTSSNAAAGKIVLATVKGDVHDIGKNIVSVILACNNYEVIDLGVMVPPDRIIETAIEKKADIIGLSGLITPSLEEMCRIASELERRGLRIPLLIGGATTSELHTAVKIAPLYGGVVIYAKDASQDPIIAAKLLNPALRDGFIEEVKERQRRLREGCSEREMVSFDEAESKRFVMDWSGYRPVKPASVGVPLYFSFGIDELIEYINWIPFFALWKLGGKFASAAHAGGCDRCRASWVAQFAQHERAQAEEAMRLYSDALGLLKEISGDAECRINVGTVINRASSAGNRIDIYTDNGRVGIATLRQQEKKNEAGAVYYSLADFIAPESSGMEDFIGAFAVTAGTGIAARIERMKCDGDEYGALLLQSLSDRLAEAGAALLHYRVRHDIWGFAPNERPEPAAILHDDVVGIRPAVGYPSLPDQSLIFDLAKIIDFKRTGIEITENGAMSPSSSVAGFIIANPEARYFVVRIGEEQRKLYLAERGLSPEEGKKWVSA